MMALFGSVACGFVVALALADIADRAWPPALTSEPSRSAWPLGWAIALAALFGLLQSANGPGMSFGRQVFVGSAMMLVAYVNERSGIIPNVLSLSLVAIGLALSLVGPPGITSSVLGIVLGAGGLFLAAFPFFAIHRKPGVGMGLIKLHGAIGSLLGWKLMLVATVVGSVLGALRIPLGIMRRPDGSTNFAADLAIGVAVALLWGDVLLTWYMGHLSD